MSIQVYFAICLSHCISGCLFYLKFYIKVPVILGHYNLYSCVFLNCWYLKSSADTAYHFWKVTNICTKINYFYKMQSCEIFHNVKKFLVLCLDTKLLTVTSQCINFCRANYCTGYLHSLKFTWNRKTFSSLISWLHCKFLYTVRAKHLHESLCQTISEAILLCGSYV